jgi:hypothetical protein
VWAVVGCACVSVSGWVWICVRVVAGGMVVDARPPAVYYGLCPAADGGVSAAVPALTLAVAGPLRPVPACSVSTNEHISRNTSRSNAPVRVRVRVRVIRPFICHMPIISTQIGKGR